MPGVAVRLDPRRCRAALPPSRLLPRILLLAAILSALLPGGSAGRMKANDQKHRQKFSEEQFKAGIGKSTWKRESGATHDKRRKRAQTEIKDLRATAKDLRKQIPKSTPTVIGREERDESRRSVHDLTAMEKEAEELLQRVRDEKNTAMKQKTRGKKSRRRLQRAEANVDDPRNWKSMY